MFTFDFLTLHALTLCERHMRARPTVRKFWSPTKAETEREGKASLDPALHTFQLF
jgi:hypothetical protein